MKHYIIAKFNEQVADKAAAVSEITALYAGACEVPGVSGVRVIPNVVSRPNRYDVMIVLDMAPEALNAWDGCALHHQWKDTWGPLLEKKCIFDAEG